MKKLFLFIALIFLASCGGNRILNGVEFQVNDVGGILVDTITGDYLVNNQKNGAVVRVGDSFIINDVEYKIEEIDYGRKKVRIRSGDVVYMNTALFIGP